MKREFDLIVFDWDGTLMDSEAKIVRCMTNAALDAGIPDPGAPAIRHIIGLGLDEAMCALFPEVDAARRDLIVERYREHFVHLDDTTTDLFPGVSEGLDALKRSGYLLAVATGKARRGLDRVLDQTGTAHLFSATRCADEAFSKPHPQMLRDLLDRTSTAAERALMVGDTVYDLEMARNARVPGLAVSYGAHPRERLMDCAPLACLDSFTEVRAWLM
jgi:phosphoglycolate phosphatase